MKSSVLAAVLVAVVALPAWAGVGSVPLEPAGIEVQGRLTLRGTLRLTVLLERSVPTQRAVHLVRLTAMPSGTRLLTLVTGGAPTAVTEMAFDTESTALKAPVTGEALTLQAAKAPPGDNRIRVEYITQLDTGEVVTQAVGEAQFPTLEEFHFSMEPGLMPDMVPQECGYCGESRCGCARCPELIVCCPACAVYCAPNGC